MVSKKTTPRDGKKKAKLSKVHTYVNPKGKINEQELIFCSVDPGFSNPGMSVMKEDGSHIFSLHINGQGIVGTDYERVFKISEILVEELRKVSLDKNPICLIIEGSSFTRNSNSLEQLAKCRQGAYDIFRSNPFINLRYFIEVSPLEAKRDSTGDTKADKIKVFEWAKKEYPSVFSFTKKHFNTVQKTNERRRKKKGDRKLSKKSENLADTLAICYSGIKRFKENNEEYFKI